MIEETKIWELEGVLAREVHRLEWLPLAKAPGLDGLDIPGVSCKYLGKVTSELWMNLQMTWDLRRAEMRRKAS